MKESSHLHKAKQMIDEVRGMPLSTADRSRRAIELAGELLQEANRIETHQEKAMQRDLQRIVQDPKGKAFTTAFTDECFRSNRPARVANQIDYLLDQFGALRFLTPSKKIQLKLFRLFGATFPKLFVKLAKKMIRKESSHVILPGELNELDKHIRRRNQEGVRVNLNHLGEAILGEEEALKRLQIYLEDLANPHIEYISVKISTICSQLNLIAWDNTLDILAMRLRQLYRAARDHTFVRKDGTKVPKFVNLDMEEYRDLDLTIALFTKVLDEPEFLHFSAGIVLQSYLPDSYLHQQELTLWAMKRVGRGGAPIKIRLVKGANMAMEQVEASVRGWPLATFNHKQDTDINFKRMLAYGCAPEHASAARLGIGSHNLFDIAYALLLRSEQVVQPFVTFEMLEGMADPMRRAVQAVAGDMLLYCPAATQAEFQNAIAYLVRRLDENSAPENFLRYIFNLQPGTQEWKQLATTFSLSCQTHALTGFQPRRTQNRLLNPEPPNPCTPFENEPDTDFSLAHNRLWAQQLLKSWSESTITPIPLCVNGQRLFPSTTLGSHHDPSRPGKVLYEYALASWNEVDKALNAAQEAGPTWGNSSTAERSQLLANIAQRLRVRRTDLIGAMVADTGKTIPEADTEVSEAIDFAEYYRRNAETLMYLEDLRFKPKGTVLIAPPWNFPCSIPAGGILAALAAGNCVIFKPAQESVLVGWILAQTFWEAGVSPQALQFINCEDEPIGSTLVKDPRIDAVILTGATATAEHLLKLRPGLPLMAETGGKNSIIVTSLADRDLAVRDIVQSAFGHAGQKCSACSLVILEAELYDNPHFLNHLKDATASLRVGSAWNPATRLNPLIKPPAEKLLRGLLTLEPDEQWLLQPKEDSNNPHLWTPGIKLGVKPGSFTHQTELFGPVLGVMRADNLQHAIELANGTPYGLTAGIHSLDEREVDIWLNTIEAGNCYVNRGITGAIVQRQPFGGCKASSFGRGAKAGGPNYVLQLFDIAQHTLPNETQPPSPTVASLTPLMTKLLRGQELQWWNVSISSYAYHWNHYFSKSHDPSLLWGQDNFQEYLPHHEVHLRVNPGDIPLDIMRVAAAAVTCGTPLEISAAPGALTFLNGAHSELVSLFTVAEESESQFIERIPPHSRVRLLSDPSEELQRGLAEWRIVPQATPVLANGRVELLNYVREVSISIDYHRYGNLGMREKEPRRPLPGTPTNTNTCHNCHCHAPN